jgi:hypothetical protein
MPPFKKLGIAYHHPTGGGMGESSRPLCGCVKVIREELELSGA